MILSLSACFHTLPQAFDSTYTPATLSKPLKYGFLIGTATKLEAADSLIAMPHGHQATSNGIDNIFDSGTEDSFFSDLLFSSTTEVPRLQDGSSQSALTTMATGEGKDPFVIDDSTQGQLAPARHSSSAGTAASSQRAAAMPSAGLDAFSAFQPFGGVEDLLGCGPSSPTNKQASPPALPLLQPPPVTLSHSYRYGLPRSGTGARRPEKQYDGTSNLAGELSGEPIAQHYHLG
ncbi:unnamed protein product [Protopolystoma xenopodis]|uniref:Uncharacterized protein n=1 Tax=Protopolystoma xenopodis TaxID=117903 RepID=A0A448WK10_9PLAT|nr:unnamed protein product [Protopolystoma xenopodis]